MGIQTFIARFSRPPDYAQYEGNDGNDQQDMNQSASTIYKKPQDPSYDQNDRDEIQQTPHK